MSVRFRRATNRDCALAQRIIDGALREHGLHVLLDSADADLTDIERHYDARRGVFEIVEGDGGEPLGVLAWRPASEAGAPIVELKKLYLTPAARGRGLGRRLLERVVDVARASGARAIVLETAEALADANRLYTRFGFVPVRGSAAATFATLSEQCDLAYRLDLGASQPRAQAATVPAAGPAPTGDHPQPGALVDIDLIVVPYDSAHRGERMGAGPEALIAAGLVTRLERAGHRVTSASVEPAGGSWRAEIRTAFELATGIAARVRAARADGRLPVVLAGNCFAALGVVAGLGAGTRVVWCDAHADFNTPETTTTGFLDGMGLAAVTGRCWTAMADQVPGFAPVPETDVWLAGARDLDGEERLALERSAIRLVPVAEMGTSLGTELRARVAAEGPLYLHLDLDVLDPAEGRANSYATPDGVSAEALTAFCAALGPPAAVTVSAYDPAADGDARVARVAMAAVEALLS